MKIRKEVVDRCPKDKGLVYREKCLACIHSGTSWCVDKPGRPYTYKVNCKYKEKGD